MRSSIHKWGLFASVRLEPHTLVIEYLGEVIRQKVADLREKEYDITGEGSCYMFKVDDDEIIDSTKRGNIARYINHSCDPNCYTRVETVGGQKRILVFTNKVVQPFTEITYNYFFASEKEKVNCSCGAFNCTGRLN